MYYISKYNGLHVLIENESAVIKDGPGLINIQIVHEHNHS